MQPFIRYYQMINRKGNQQTLKLQSYKIDSSLLTSKINELNQLKSQLQSSLSQHRSQENSIMNQIDQLKSQNQKLKGEVSNLEFLNKRKNNLIEELQLKIVQLQKTAIQYRQMYENESKNIKQLSIFYKKKISSLLQDKQTLSSLYQSKIANLLQHIQNLQNNKNYFTYSPSDYNSRVQSQGQLQQDSIKKKKKYVQSQRDKKTTILPQKYLTSNVIVQKEEDSNLSGQDIYIQMIQNIYKQLLKIESKAQDLLKIPQIEGFSQLRNPSKNDLAKLFSSYPFHVRQNNKIELIFDFISRQLTRRHLPFAGKFIIKGLIQAIQKISNANETRIKSFEIQLENSKLLEKNQYYKSQFFSQERIELNKISKIVDDEQSKANIDLQGSSSSQSNMQI